MDRASKLEITDADAKQFTRGVLVERLVANGVSRLTAERIVELKRGDAEPGRARPHAQSRR